MDYVLGSIADMISGNVTPNRPKIAKRALTPIKHMQSPNVTPKSELVEDRSIFLSPTTQKKKAIVKKSPKRIFQNPDLDITNENEDNPSATSPKADKVKKHLKNQLEADENVNKSKIAVKSSKKKSSKSGESGSPIAMAESNDLNGSCKENVSVNELTPKKKKRQRNSESEANENTIVPVDEGQSEEIPTKKKKQKKNSTSEDVQDNIQADSGLNTNTNVSLKKKKDLSNTQVPDELANKEGTKDKESKSSIKKKNKKRKNKKLAMQENGTENEDDEESKQKKSKKKIKVNPNAITDKDSDSEHESDNEIESENEEANKKVLENSAEAADSSSDEEETPKPKKKEKKGKKEKVENQETEPVREVNTAEEIARTLFVGNVLFSKKCKKEIKKVFSKYGHIDSVRIRTVPVKDPSMTPKVAVIKQELHPERTTVNVYVKFANPTSVDEALAENNTVLNGHHLRVTRSGSTGAEHDARRAVFVGNVPFALEDDALRERFAGCGDIESVRIVRDKKTNAGKGFAYVNFASKDGVELALALTEEDLTIKNRIMRVKRCTQVTQRQAQKREFKPQGIRPGARPGERPGMRPGSQPRQFPGKKVSQGDRQRNFQGGKNQGFQGNRFGRQDNRGEKTDGAYRRINKRKSQEAGEGPPSKAARADQPREKKARKEFVGMTAEKKKKHKFDKGLKKKKALSEILTK